MKKYVTIKWCCYAINSLHSIWSLFPIQFKVTYDFDDRWLVWLVLKDTGRKKMEHNMILYIKVLDRSRQKQNQIIMDRNKIKNNFYLPLLRNSFEGMQFQILLGKNKK